MPKPVVDAINTLTAYLILIGSESITVYHDRSAAIDVEKKLRDDYKALDSLFMAGAISLGAHRK
jgi:hypothetical protein